MANDPETQTQLARLLRDESVRTATPDQLRTAVEAGFDVLVEGVVAEASASDDVFDHDSAVSFVRLRIDALKTVLDDAQASRLFEAVQGKIEAW